MTPLSTTSPIAAPCALRFRSGHALVVVMALLIGVTGCTQHAQPFNTQPATPSPRTTASQELRSLPAPQEPVVVAVYRFRDQTGQYRALENMSTFSTAVTQGSTSILIRALEDSGWFVPIEREGLSNLLNERQIVQGIRAQHVGPNGEQLGPLPPLMYAGVLLEGGIIGYDTNVLTHGAGIRYFGAGGSGAVRQDQVTIYLRAVSTQSGRVLKTVYTTKTILSQRAEGGIFRYVALRRLLEAEAGYSFNEPPVLAVTEAIEEAVRALVIEGVREGLWALQNPNDAQHPSFLSYDRAMAEAEHSDAFQRQLRPDAAMSAIGLTAGATLYQGDFRDPLLRPAFSVVARYPFTPGVGLELNVGGGQFAADNAFETTYAAADLSAIYIILPNRPFTPFVTVGVGALMQPDPPQGTGNQFFPYATAGGGVEVRVGSRVGLLAGANFSYLIVDGVDGVQSGGMSDSFLNFRGGLVYYMPIR